MQYSYRPSQTFHSYWVYCLDYELTKAFPYQDGKWMMFFPMREMDQRWSEACHLYNRGELHGIHSMKASTVKQNPMPERLHGYDEGIIIFYCGPSEHRHNVMAYGRNLLNKMNYPRSKLYYKSDVPHLINYSNEYRHMYYIDTYDHYSRMMTMMMNTSQQQSAKRNYSAPSKYMYSSYANEDSESPVQTSPEYFTKDYTDSRRPLIQYAYRMSPKYLYSTNYLYTYF